MLTKSKQSKGFTIIEVMIVLAIAGLIILIVLLAVPALQRNSRNTAIKQDASAIIAGVAEFKSNNDGGKATKGGSSQSGSTLTINNATGTAATAKVQGSTVVTFDDNNSSPTWPGPGNILVDYGVKCTSNTAVAVSTRSVAVIYVTESSSGDVKQCIEG